MSTFEKIMGGSVILLVAVLVLPMIGIQFPTLGVAPGVPGAPAIGAGACPAGYNLPSAPSVTINTPDLYGGAAVTSMNIIRLQGTSTWTEVNGTSTFNANPGDTYEVVFGIGDSTTKDDDVPFGPKITYTVPCEAYPKLSRELVDDSIEGDLVIRFWDPEDGTVISTSAPIDIDEGDLFNIKGEWQASFEEDYGNRFCGMGMAAVVEYLSSNFTGWYLTDMSGAKYPSCSTPSLHSTTSGYVTKCFEVPVLKSNMLWSFYAVADATGSGKEPDGSGGNVTVTLYDPNWYINNDVTPPQVCLLYTSPSPRDRS